MVEKVDFFFHFTSVKKRLGEMGEEGKLCMRQPNLVAVSVFQSAAL